MIEIFTVFVDHDRSDNGNKMLSIMSLSIKIKNV